MIADTTSSKPQLSPETRRMIQAACTVLGVPVTECAHRRWQSDIRFGKIGFFKERCLDCGFERECEYPWHGQEEHLKLSEARKRASQKEWRRNQAARARSEARRLGVPDDGYSIEEGFEIEWDEEDIA